MFADFLYWLAEHFAERKDREWGGPAWTDPILDPQPVWDWS